MVKTEDLRVMGLTGWSLILWVLIPVLEDILFDANLLDVWILVGSRLSLIRPDTGGTLLSANGVEPAMTNGRNK